MTTGLYLSAMSQNSGKSLVALGLADSLIKRAIARRSSRVLLRAWGHGDLVPK